MNNGDDITFGMKQVCQDTYPNGSHMVFLLSWKESLLLHQSLKMIDFHVRSGWEEWDS